MCHAFLHTNLFKKKTMNYLTQYNIDENLEDYKLNQLFPNDTNPGSLVLAQKSTGE